MILELLTLLTVWICSAALQIVVHKIYRIVSGKSFLTIIAFAPGALWHVATEYRNDQTLFAEYNLGLSSLVLYALLTGIYTVYYTASVKNYGSPTSKILRLVREGKAKTKAEIMSAFSRKELVDDRIQDLLDSGLITKQRSTVKATEEGKRVAALVSFHRKVIGV